MVKNIHPNYLFNPDMGYMSYLSVPAEILIAELQMGNKIFKIDEHIGVKINSNRILTFTKGLHCVKCGVEGKFFSLQIQVRSKIRKEDPLEVYPLTQNLKGMHFNLYGVKDDGSFILMTSDHITPKSRGGDNSLDNRQTMCTLCNCEKGDAIEDILGYLSKGKYLPNCVRLYNRILLNLLEVREIWEDIKNVYPTIKKVTAKATRSVSSYVESRLKKLVTQIKEYKRLYTLLKTNPKYESNLDPDKGYESLGSFLDSARFSYEYLKRILGNIIFTISVLLSSVPRHITKETKKRVLLDLYSIYLSLVNLI